MGWGGPKELKGLRSQGLGGFGLWRFSGLGFGVQVLEDFGC